MDAWKSLVFDAIVIGSGPGGATVAAELSKQGKTVLILEWGSGATIKGNVLQATQMALIPGRSLFFTPDMLGLMRAITLGGSSVMAYATVFEPPYEVFEKHGIDLKPEVKQVYAELPIASLADDLVGPSAWRIMMSAKILGYPWEKLPKLVHQDKCRPDCDKCTMGCPYGAKWTAREYIEQACSNGSTLLTNARVTRLMVEKDHVSGVQFSMHGSHHSVSAPLVILAAGGLGSPPILHASGIMNAGTDFFFDPLVMLVGRVEDLEDGKEFPMAAGIFDPGEGYVLTDIVIPHWVRVMFTLPVLKLDRLGGQRSSLPIMVKIKDDLAGKISPHGRVIKRLSNDDRTRLRRGSEVARSILKYAGAHRIYSCMVVATHPGGTAKIGDVVDSNLKTSYDNLYVCDCSVIPESWGRPPILTLIALGKRLAKHLA
jgi:choline dehydrogenase-like flavoprotein